MSDQNSFCCTGRLGADPEQRQFPNGKPVVNFRVAVSETWKDRNTGERKETTLWLPVVITSEGLCGIASSYLRKGSRVALSGALKPRSYEKDGQTVNIIELHLSPFGGTMTLLDSAGSGDSDAGRASSRQAASSAPPTRGRASVPPSFDGDSEIPF